MSSQPPTLSCPVQVSVPGSKGRAFVVPSSPMSMSSVKSGIQSHLTPAMPSLSRTVSEASSSFTGPISVPSPLAPATTASALPSRPIAEFLFHLTRMLTDPSNRHLIEWTDGKIRVHDPCRLESEVLGKFYRHSKYSSFQRQLNYFGFKKVDSRGKMSPCWFINEDTTDDLTSLLSIKRKAANRSRKAHMQQAEGSSSNMGRSVMTGDEVKKPTLVKRKEGDVLPTAPLSKRPRVISLAAKDDRQIVSSTHTFVTAEEFGAPGTVNLQEVGIPAVASGLTSMEASSPQSSAALPAGAFVPASYDAYSSGDKWENLHLPSAIEGQVSSAGPINSASPTSVVAEENSCSVPNPLALPAMPVLPPPPILVRALSPSPVQSSKTATDEVIKREEKDLDILYGFPSVEDILSLGVPSCEAIFPSDGAGEMCENLTMLSSTCSLVDLAMIPRLPE